MQDDVYTRVTVLNDGYHAGTLIVRTEHANELVRRLTGSTVVEGIVAVNQSAEMAKCRGSVRYDE